MNKNITTLAALAAAIAGFGVYIYTQKPADTSATSPTPAKKTVKSLSVIGQKRADFKLPDLEGKIHTISEWDGKVILLNFWATWCPPCRREIPAFIELQDTYGKQGFQVIGVAIDEKDAVIDFRDGLGINYPLLLGDNSALNISQAYGNRYGQLPYSLIIDRKGIIRFVGKRELSFKDIETQIKPLL